MKKKMTAPLDDYSTDWNVYWEQNPHLRRSVGADGADDDAAAAAAAEEAANAEKLAKYDALAAQLEANNAELEKFKSKHAEAEKHRKEQEKAAQKAAEEAAKKSGDFEAYQKSVDEKISSIVGEKDAKIQSYEAMIQDLTVGSTATAIASELALDGSAEVLIPHIKSQLDMELRDGKPTVVVLADGKPSALTLDDLKKKIGSMPAFAPILKGSNASGGGHNNGDGSQAHGKTMKRSEFDALTPVAQHQFVTKEKGKVVD